MAWGDADKIVAPASAATWGANDPVVTPPSASFREGQRAGRKGVTGGLDAAMTTMEEAIPFADEATAVLPSLYLMTQGRKPAEAWQSVRDYQKGKMAGLKEDHPIVSGMSTGLGYGVSALPIVMSGGAAAPEVAANVTGRTLAQRGGGMLMTGARNATKGAAFAASSAAAGRGDLSERTKAAGDAVLPGAAVGVAAPVVVDAVGGAARMVGNTAAGMAKTGLRAANAMADKTAGGAFLDPHAEVVNRLAEALQKDRIPPAQVEEALAEWNRVGGASPAFVDIVGKNGGGQNTLALVRGAAMSGSGRNEAAKYGAKVAADMQDAAVARTAALTPDEPRPASVVTDQIKRFRRNAATEQYPAFADQPVPVGDDILSAADGSADWMQGAAKMAVAERKFGVADEIANLVNGQKPKTVSAGALDYMRRALRDQAAAAGRRGEGGLAEGLRGRAQDLETALMDVPGFRTARDTYKGFSQQAEAIDGNPKRGVIGGRQVLQTMPDEYAAAAAKDGGAAPLRMVGARQTMTDTIGAPAGNATGTLNRLASGANMTRNLAATFGEAPAADYQASLGNIIDKTNTARFINPNTGSGTAGRLSDEQLVELPTSKAGAVRWILDKFRSGATLTDAERAELMKLATGGAGEGMARIAPRLQAQPDRVRMTGPRISPALAGPMTAQDNRR